MKFGFFAHQLAHIMQLRITSITGLENIPKTGPVLFVSNHVGQQDPVLLYTTITLATNGQMVHAIAKWKILSGKFFQNHFGTIPLYEDRSKSINTSINILKNNEFVLIFPEGGVNKNNTINKVKTGAARIALSSKAIIIPIGIQRTSTIPKTEFGHTMDIFFGCAKIAIGSPIDLNAYYNKEVNEQLLNEVNKVIMPPVAKLANKKYLTTY